MDTTFDEARRCPKCGELGQVGRTIHRRFAKEVTCICINSRCKWYNTGGWIVTVSDTGEVHQPTTNRPKNFPAIPDRTEEVRRNIDESIRESLETT